MADSSASVHYSCLVAAQAVVVAKALADIPTANIIVRKFPSDRELTGPTQLPLPAIILSVPLNESEIPGLTGKDTIGYPVVVTIIRASNQDLTANLEEWLIWRQTIRRAFIHQRLAAVTEIMNCEVEMGPIFDTSVFVNQNLDVGGMVLRFFSRETRG